MRYTLLLFPLLAFCCTGFKNASPVGSWKRTGLTITSDNGKINDIQQAFLSSTPCASNVTYSFLANGIMQVTAPSCDAITRAIVEGVDNDSRWVLNGNKLTVKSRDSTIPEAHYNISFTTGTMTWVLIYAENNTIPNPTKAKVMTITYQHLKN